LWLHEQFWRTGAKNFTPNELTLLTNIVGTQPAAHWHRKAPAEPLPVITRTIRERKVDVVTRELF